MTNLVTGPADAVSLPEQETGLARDSGLALAGFVHDDDQRLTLRLEDPESGRTVEIRVPAVALRLLARALTSMAEGHSVALLPVDAELSTQQAADLLGVSRPYLVKLLEEGRIPFRKVGAQRRVRLDALRLYIANYQRQASAALAEMAADAQRAGLYD